MAGKQLGADYVIVGAGSAGCVLAARLSEDPGARVLLLEAGGPDYRWDWRLHMPAAFSIPMHSKRLAWGYWTEPEANLGGRRLFWPRGKVLGGSSSINGMAYVRGHAFDYDGWAQTNGLEHWSYADCLPYFRKAETRDRGTDDYRGGTGPLHVTTGDTNGPLTRAWVAAGQQAGYPLTPDMNGYQQEGVGAMQRTTHGGRRWSASVAYLRPAMGRPNLTVVTGAHSLRVLFEGGRAVGVRIARGRHVEDISADRELILAAGAINSPHLLMLSGIGPAANLAAAGVEVKHDLPGVGKNLQDHLEVYIQHACRRPVSLYSATRPLGRIGVGLRWLLFHNGAGASNHFEAGGFIRSRPGVRHPDLQYHFLPVAVNYDGSKPADGHGFQAHVGPMRSQSRGRLELQAADPLQPVRILANYMAHEDDWREMRAAVRLTREILAQPAFNELSGGELAPGPNVTSDTDIDQFVRERVESAYHPCGACKMGLDDDAVVDGDLKVHGLDGLRVVDSSVMPNIVSGNLNAPTIMIAEKAADLIRGRTPAHPPAPPVYAPPDWQNRQR